MKITGPRSLQTKLWRLADELAADARRVDAEGGDGPLVNSLVSISSQCSQLAKYLGEKPNEKA